MTTHAPDDARQDSSLQHTDSCSGTIHYRRVLGDCGHEVTVVCDCTHMSVEKTGVRDHGSIELLVCMIAHVRGRLRVAEPES